MGRLTHITSGTAYTLFAQHLIGRSPSTMLRLSSKLVSSSHAELRWNGACWEVHDLNSRNGTFVDGEALQPGEHRPIGRGTEIAFGDVADTYQLSDDSPPLAWAESEHGVLCEAEKGFLTLSEAQNLLYTIFDEGGGRWIAESSDGQRQIMRDGDKLRIGEVEWTLHLPMVIEQTSQLDSSEIWLRQATLRLRVGDGHDLMGPLMAPDEGEPGEGGSLPKRIFVNVELVCGNQIKHLQPRVHHTLLYELAKIRLRDSQDPNMSQAEAGWEFVDQLLSELRISNNYLNQQILRMRKQLAEHGVRDAADIVERRLVTKKVQQVRLGAPLIEIIRL